MTTLTRALLRSCARGCVMGGAIFTWEVAPSSQVIALIGVAAVIVGAFFQEVLA